jgi:hypothetical protein
MVALDFANDVVTKVGEWIWVKLDTMTAVDLAAVSLRRPADVYAVLVGHSESDGPITLDAIQEKP